MVSVWVNSAAAAETWRRWGRPVVRADGLREAARCRAGIAIASCVVRTTMLREECDVCAGAEDLVRGQGREGPSRLKKGHAQRTTLGARRRELIDSFASSRGPTPCPDARRTQSSFQASPQKKNG